MDDSMIGRWLSEVPMGDPARQRMSRPTLRRFIHHDKPIAFRNCLGDGMEGVIFRVRINGEVYVLKVFKIWRYGNSRINKRSQPYTFPISHEARAFARLDTINENGTWAVKCHGWIKLSDEVFKQKDYKQRWPWGGLSPWAIVKDYIPHRLRITDIPEIRRKMNIALDLGRVKTYPYIPKLWSDRERRAWFQRFDEDAATWQEWIGDGRIVHAWVNDQFKKWRTEHDERRKKQEEENEGKIALGLPVIPLSPRLIYDDEDKEQASI